MRNYKALAGEIRQLFESSFTIEELRAIMSRAADAIEELLQRVESVASDGNALTQGGRMKIEMPVQVNIPIEEVIDYLNKDGTLVEVVRCKDCKYRYTTPDFCNVLLDGCRWACEESPDDDDFCSYGERKA